VSLFYERIPLSSEPNPEILTPAVLRRADIGESYWGDKLDAIPDHLSYKDVIAGYIMKIHEYERGGYGLLLSGEFGTGKTSLGSIILKEALMRRARCFTVRCAVMVDRLWSKQRQELPNGAPFEEGLTNVNFLFIDDFEVFDSTPKNRAVEQIIYARYARRLPTIIATNLKWKDVFDLPYLKSLLTDRYWPCPVVGINWREKPPTDPNRLTP